MRAVTDADFDKTVLAGGTVLVDFWAGWCGPCRQMAPMLAQLDRDLGDRLTVVQLDVDANPVTAGRYAVSGLPTVILFRDGEPVQRVVGLKPRPVLQAALEPWMP